jgi:DNA-directed RNA polymerase specialized sigma24 family protein
VAPPTALDENGISGNREFPSTSWSVIANARDAGSPDYVRHLERLVRLYWRPVYSLIRHGWHKCHDDAKDLTQEFFARVVLDRELVKAYAPERGSFRSLVRAAITSFMRDVAREAGSQKRGGGRMPASLESVGEEAAPLVPGAEALTPEQIFDLAWNASVLEAAVGILERRLKAEGKAAAFEVFRRYDLEGDSAEMSYADLGRDVGLTAPQVKHALLGARAAFREVVTELVRGYVDAPADLAAELRRLLGA